MISSVPIIVCGLSGSKKKYRLPVPISQFLSISLQAIMMLLHYVMADRELHQSLHKVVVFTQSEFGSGSQAGLKQQRVALAQKCTGKNIVSIK